MSGWVRQRGRADYVGWLLYIRGTTAEMNVGKSLVECLFWLAWWKLRPAAFLGLPICGDVLEVHLAHRRLRR